jgi:hypothetical protein
MCYPRFVSENGFGTTQASTNSAADFDRRIHVRIQQMPLGRGTLSGLLTLCKTSNHRSIQCNIKAVRESRFARVQISNRGWDLTPEASGGLRLLDQGHKLTTQIKDPLSANCYCFPVVTATKSRDHTKTWRISMTVLLGTSLLIY